MHRPTRHCKCLLVRGWALSSVRNFQGTLHGRPCRFRAARCSQSCRARDGAWRDILCFSRLLSDRILRPPTCLVRPAVRPALGVGSRHAAMHLREAQGKSMDTIMATGDERTPEWRCLAQLAKPHQKIAQFRAPLRPHRRHHGRRPQARWCLRQPMWPRRVAGEGPELVCGVRMIVRGAQTCLIR